MYMTTSEEITAADGYWQMVIKIKQLCSKMKAEL